MPTLNVLLPKQLRHWVSLQVKNGNYASASDYVRDLVRGDIRHQEHDRKWLSDYLNPLWETPANEFVSVSPDDIKSLARQRFISR